MLSTCAEVVTNHTLGGLLSAQIKEQVNLKQRRREFVNRAHPSLRQFAGTKVCMGRIKSGNVDTVAIQQLLSVLGALTFVIAVICVQLEYRAAGTVALFPSLKAVIATRMDLHMIVN